MKRIGNREQENVSELRSRRRTTRGSERCSGAFDSERERERERESVAVRALSRLCIGLLGRRRRRRRRRKGLTTRKSRT
jgi:hypothetical protein